MQSYEPIPDIVLSSSVADASVTAQRVTAQQVTAQCVTAQYNGAPTQNPPPFDYCITTAICACEYLWYVTAAVTALCGMCR
jgi:hypothetical protein